MKLLTNGRAPLNIQDKDDPTALHLAVFYKDQIAVDILLEAGAAVNIKDRWGSTPLFHAIRNGDRHLGSFHPSPVGFSPPLVGPLLTASPVRTPAVVPVVRVPCSRCPRAYVGGVRACIATSLIGNVDIDKRIDDMATAITKYVRYGSNSQLARGEIIRSKPYGSIRWGYFIVPIVTEALSILFAILTVFSNRRSRRVPL
ncbi:hypothetical protein FE257_006698 [Aspergillus nanangensis]|uniref:Uncharacterized protein n=1 Tax=Aspergillus nanangensis TaxID=2582783 RepID=A0AAD4CPH4_ASPNN|nr:hypothetical protein FE257_006698 [Aspergillus nanangensis]